jgi:uncharacterized protein (TIGR02001 family)
MARGRLLAGIVKSGIVGAALIAGFAGQAYAGDPPKLTFSGSAWLTTDYMFRSVSNTNQNPAAQVEFDAAYGIFWAYVWSSNTSFSPDNIEIDYGGGISPKWLGIDWTIGGLEYTFPGNDDLAYFELWTQAAHTFGNLTLRIGNWWSPDNFGGGYQSDAVEGGASYAFTGKLFNFFTPSISGALGVQTFENTVPDYTYWNLGVTLGFLDHWSADIRYYDTNASETDCLIIGSGRHNCDARAVGTIKATF